MSDSHNHYAGTAPGDGSIMDPSTSTAHNHFVTHHTNHDVEHDQPQQANTQLLPSHSSSDTPLLSEEDNGLAMVEEEEEMHHFSQPKPLSTRMKWVQVAIVGSLAFATPLGSSIYTPALPQLISELSPSEDPSLATLTISAYIFGFSTGPLLIAPLSAVYGKVRLYRLCAVLWALFSALAAVAPNIWSLVALRFLAGCVGGTPMVLGSSTVADLFDKEVRGRALSFIAVGSVSAPLVGPAAGGRIAQSALGWRGCFVLLACVGVVNAALTFVGLRESAPDGTSEKSAAPKKTAVLLRDAAVRPLTILLHPSVASIVILSSFFYSVQVWLYVDVPARYEDVYSFSPAEAGSVFIFMGIGTLVGLLVCGTLSDRVIATRAARSEDGEKRAEHRLPLTVSGGAIVSLSMVLYSFGAERDTWWVIPACGNALMGMGLFAISMSSALFLVDLSTKQAVSTSAAMGLVRFAMGSLSAMLMSRLESSLGFTVLHSGVIFCSCLATWFGYWLFKNGKRLQNDKDLEEFAYTSK
ncbi:hypothetical protein MCOR25_000820 [Pyricularia grisea]|uniref:Major facilitator superfamily (MFS) profile domain-containing protein n=1 Tax=Pyricularia grisea TaxID=148305 RepID=A0A6P8AR33_PYRGI|nr:uncharacterized protein PgNI_11941 [Pyricularia grisea]KAI6382231.1 hypothetical protein MCOR25_000820 [Pyricularia grisea]TLD04525.1 hypothetical protein PgNI_11941 [Pyricularia grisea]